MYVPTVLPECSISDWVLSFIKVQSSSFGERNERFTFPSLSFLGVPSSFISVVTINSFVLPTQSRGALLVRR